MVIPWYVDTRHDTEQLLYSVSILLLGISKNHGIYVVYFMVIPWHLLWKAKFLF